MFFTFTQVLSLANTLHFIKVNNKQTRLNNNNKQTHLTLCGVSEFKKIQNTFELHKLKTTTIHGG